MISLENVRQDKHRKKFDQFLEQLLREKKIIAEQIDGETKYTATAGGYYKDGLADDELNADFERELVYELGSRGLVHLSQIDGEWRWCLTRKGQKSVLSSYNTPLHEAWTQLGLDKVADRMTKLKSLTDETGLFKD